MTESTSVLKLTLNFDRYLESIVQIRLEGDSIPTSPLFIEALLLKTEVFTRNFSLNGAPVQPIDGLLQIPSAPFVLTYEITSPYQVCVGAHVDHPVDYPMFNEHQVHLGSGVLPILERSGDPAKPTLYRVHFEGIPNGWSVCSNVPEDPAGAVVPMEQLTQVFIHVSDDLQVFESPSGRLRYVLGHGVQPPISAEKIFEFCQNSIEFQERAFGPNPKIRNLLILHLQAPEGFKKLTQGMTMAMAKNYTGGIALFGSDEIENYGPFGHPDYLDFVLFGLHHEIGHAFTSAGPARFKSLLHASEQCSRSDRFRIGEVLNSYFNPATRLLFDQHHPFRLRDWVEKLLRVAEEKKPSMMIDWFLFDCALRSRMGISLAAVYRQMLAEKRATDTPYDSIDFVFSAAEHLSGRTLDGSIRQKLISPDLETYPRQILESLTELGKKVQELASDREGTIRFLLGDEAVDSEPGNG
jgi:hypothetical protein